MKRKRTIKQRLLKLRKDGIRKRFLMWLIEILLPHHHLAANGGRKKKGVETISFKKGLTVAKTLDDSISVSSGDTK